MTKAPETGRRGPMTGVLLINLGTPNAPTARAVRRYLAEFLNDRRVVDLPRAAWLPILYGLILPFRPTVVARRYAGIWDRRGSPLAYRSGDLAEAVETRLRRVAGAPFRVALGMRYGEPAVGPALDALLTAGCDRLVVLPLYPQYAASTTGSAFDALAAALGRQRAVPAVRFIESYAEHPAWVAAVAESVREFQARRGRPDRLLFSFHGLPKAHVDAGDPYLAQCRASARAVADRLGLDEDGWDLSFQSRLGPAEWLTPYTLDTVKAWGRKGVRRLQVVCPGFAVDCLETLEEIARMNRDAFLRAGGERFEYIPALNDRPLHAAALARVVCEHAGHWLEAAPEDRRRRAELHGLPGEGGR